MMQCKARVPNKWYHLNEGHAGADHQCPFKARKDGFCDRHHPHVLLPVLEERAAILQAKLDTVRAQIAALPEVPGATEVHSPS